MGDLSALHGNMIAVTVPQVASTASSGFGGGSITYSAAGMDPLGVPETMSEHSYAATTQLDHISSGDVGNTVTVGGDGGIDPAGSITVTVAVGAGAGPEGVNEEGFTRTN